MGKRVQWFRADTPFGDDSKWTLRVLLAFGWRFECSVQRYGRPQLLGFGAGIYLGEPWGDEGRLWAAMVRLYEVGACIGFRGPAPEEYADSGEWDFDDEEAPDAAS